jgi:hypothetical protein
MAPLHFLTLCLHSQRLKKSYMWTPWLWGILGIRGLLNRVPPQNEGRIATPGALLRLSQQTESYGNLPSVLRRPIRGEGMNLNLRVLWPLIIAIPNLMNSNMKSVRIEEDKSPEIVVSEMLSHPLILNTIEPFWLHLVPRRCKIVGRYVGQNP